MKHTLLSSYLFLALLILGLLTLFSYNLPSAYLLSSDFSRDIDQALKITQGHLTIIGPWLNFKGLLAGPYYYYFFCIPLLLTAANPNSALIFNALMFALSLGFLFQRLKRESTVRNSLLAVITIALSNLFILTSRTPGNGFSYLPLLLVILTDFYTSREYSNKHLGVLGVLSGVLVNTHPISIFILAPIFIFFLLKSRKSFAILCLGAVITYAPLMFFELLHHFQILRSFISADFSQTNSLGNFSSSQSIFGVLNSNMGIVLTDINRQFILPSILTIGLVTVFSTIIFKRSGALMLFHLFCSLVLVIILLPKTAEFHYTLPFGQLLLFLFTLALVRSTWSLLLILVITLEIFNFPVNLYKSSSRNFYTIEKRVNFLITQNILNKESSTNIIKFSDSNSFLPIGQEYRFFLRRAGYKIDSEYEYNKSKQLVIFAEYPEFDITKFHTWETGQFGNDYLKSFVMIENNGVKIYVVNKQ